VIPARGGSKGIPRKNLAPLAGRPLIAYTIEAARLSRSLSRTIVSTDDEEVAAIAKRIGADVPFVRPPHLALDHTPMIDVLVDALATLDRQEGYRPDVVVLLQPTSPFRREDHIDAAVDLLISSGADSVVTVMQVPHQFTPESLMQLRGDRLDPFVEGSTSTRRQDKPVLFARNGPAVVATRSRVVLDDHALYGADTRGVVMSREDSFDIDEAFDLKIAELLMASRPA
jgi:CMP-N,N'-diacetyllegionaminic acid synthase